MKNMQAIIFDLDGVLIDTEWISYLVWVEIVRQYGGNLTKENFPNMIGLTGEETAEYVMRATGISFEMAPTVARVWEIIIQRIQSGIEPMPGAAQLLQTLSERGYPMAIASNSPTEYIETTLQGLGLRSFFCDINSIDHVVEGKPAPDIYLRAAHRLGVSPESCLAIEDSYVGSQAAIKAGMRVLAVPTWRDKREKFANCFRVYGSLLEIHEELETALNFS